jgi:hypothetical protein
VPIYNDLRAEEDFAERDYELVFPKLRKQRLVTKRIIKNLIKLKNGLDSSVATRRAEENLIIASWNIKEFDKKNHRNPKTN